MAFGLWSRYPEMSSVPAPLGQPPFGPRDTHGSRTLAASLQLSGQQQRLLRASESIGRSGGDRAVSLTAAAEKCREIARRAELRERLSQPGGVFKRPTLPGARQRRSQRPRPGAANVKNLKASVSAPLLVSETDDPMKAKFSKADNSDDKSYQVDSSLPVLGATPATASKKVTDPFPISKYRYFADPWVARSPNFADVEGNKGLRGSLNVRGDDKSDVCSDELPRMDKPKFASAGPAKYQFFSEAGISTSPNFDMSADGGWSGLCEARRTWSGLGKVL